MLDKLIASVTNGPHSHVEIVIDDMQYSTSPRTKTLVKKEHVWDEDVWDYIKVSSRTVSAKKILRFFELTEGSMYDLMGALGIVLPLRSREQLWFCSEWVTRALQIAGYQDLWIYDAYRISPNRLFELK